MVVSGDDRLWKSSGGRVDLWVIFHRYLTMASKASMATSKGLNSGNSGLMRTVAIHVAQVLRLRT